MTQSSTAASELRPADKRSHEKRLLLSPGSDGLYRCKKCQKSYPCPEPLMFHEEGCNYAESLSPVPSLRDKLSADQTGTTGGITEHIGIDSKKMAAPIPNVRICRGVWCGDGTHYVRVSLSQSLGPESTIQRVDEDKTFTVQEFLKANFGHGEGYKDVVKRITDFDARCCRPVEATLKASSPKHSTSRAEAHLVGSGYNHAVKWLRSCFLACIPAHRRPGRWRLPVEPSGSDLLPTSHHPSTAAIIPNTEPRVSTNVTPFCKSSDSRDETEYRISTKNLPGPTYAASDRILPQAFCPYHSETREPRFHLAEAADALIPDNTTAIVDVGSFYSTCQGTRGCEVLVRTKSDNIILLPTVDFGALTGKKRFARQLQHILGEYTFDQVSQFEEKRDCIRKLVYSGNLQKEAMQMEVGKELPLEQCHPVLQAYIHSISNI